MAKIDKHEAFMDVLHGMISKEASAGTATGVPGKDTHYASVGSEHDKVDKNKQGKPEHNPQEVKQEKGKDAPIHGKAAEEAEVAKEANTAHLPDTKPAKPAKEEAHTEIKQEVKTAEANTNEKLAQLGQQLLDTITEMNKTGTAGTAGTATGVPGKDTHYASVGSEHDKVDKNKQGKPEHNPQEVKQEKGKDAPIHGKAAEELDLDKEASFALGRQFARAFLANKTAEENIYKEAGRRDFEALINKASAELAAEQPKHKAAPQAPVVKAAEANDDEALQVKQAEEAGAQAFYTMLKQAQEQEQANQIKLAFEQKVNAILTEKQAAEEKAAKLEAKLAEQEASIQKQAEEAQLDAKFAAWGGRVVEEVITRLKQTPA